MPGTHSLEAIEVAAPAMVLAKRLMPDWQRATDTATDKITAVQRANFILSHLICFEISPPPTLLCSYFYCMSLKWHWISFERKMILLCLFPSTIIIEIENDGASLLHLKNESSLSLLYPCVVRTFLPGFFSMFRVLYWLQVNSLIDLKSRHLICAVVDVYHGLQPWSTTNKDNIRLRHYTKKPTKQQCLIFMIFYVEYRW